jgi:hypothetical protein
MRLKEPPLKRGAPDMMRGRPDGVGALLAFAKRERPITCGEMGVRFVPGRGGLCPAAGRVFVMA